MLRLATLKKKEGKKGPFWVGKLGGLAIFAFEGPYGLTLSLKEGEGAQGGKTPDTGHSRANEGGSPGYVNPSPAGAPSFLTGKQIGRLYAIARQNRWPKEVVSEKCRELVGHIPEKLDKARYEQACDWFSKNPYTVAQASKVQAKAQSMDSFGDVPEWVTEDTGDDIPF